MQARAHAQVQGAARTAREAATTLRQLDRARKDKVLRALAEMLLHWAVEILEANEADLAAAPVPYELPPHLIVTESWLEELAYGLRMVAAAPDPVGEVIRSNRQRSGMQLCQLRVPIGVVAVLFEDPAIMVRSAAMLLKTGNAAVLHHLGSVVPRTETILMTILREVLETHGIPVDSAQLLCDPYRSTTRFLLRAHGGIDLVVPVLARPIPAQMRTETTVPILDIGTGNCHVYVDASADLALALRIVVDSKLPFAGVPRAAEQVLVHADVAETFIPRLTQVLSERGVGVHVDDRTSRYAPAAAIADAASWRSGYGTLDLGCAVVDSVVEAVAHINRYGNGHTEAVVTSDMDVAQRFSAGVDAAMVTVNAPTTFPHANANPMDPELAFSTHRLAPRGPLRLNEFTTTKWLAWPVELEFVSPAEADEPDEAALSSGSFDGSVPFGGAAHDRRGDQPDPRSIRAEPPANAFGEPAHSLIPTQRSRGAHAAPEPERKTRLEASG